MKPYPSYKDSGVEWIGEIPSHWDNSKIKYETVVPVQYGINISSESYVDEGIRFIRTTDITDDGKILDKGVYLKPDFVEEIYKTKRNDLLISRSGTLGRTYHHRVEDELTYGGYLVRFNFGNDKKSRFVFYFTKSKNFEDWLSLNTIQSTIGNVNGQKYSNLSLPFPTKSEQKQIVSFLDHKTQKIDELIENTEQKIDLLKEKRTSLINHCVTKGLNPNVEMKDSGVEWIGEIPSGWGFPKVRYITSIEYGNSLKEEDRIDGEYDVYGSNGVVGKHHNSLTNGETIIIGRKGSYGKINLSQNPCYPIDTTFSIEQKNTKHDIKWMFYGLGVLRLDSFTKDSSVPGINREEIYERYLPLPPLPEQQQIVDYLDEQTQKIDSTIEKETQRIELLKEYRQSLISEVVTGKIDVRDWKE